MAIKADDVTYSTSSWGVIEVKDKLYFVNTAIAKQVKDALTEQLIFTSAENPIVAALTEAADFVIDVKTGQATLKGA